MLTYQALVFNPTTFIAPRVDEALGTSNFPHLALGSMINTIEHELLIKFLELKHPTFQHIESENNFKLIINCYEKLYKMGIMKQYGICL